MHANRFLLRALVWYKSKDELCSESVCGSRTRSSATILTQLRQVFTRFFMVLAATRLAVGVLITRKRRAL